MPPQNKPDPTQPHTNRPNSFIQHERGADVSCMHGPSECAGNLLQLCVAAHTPDEHNHSWLMKFLLCTWDSGLPRDSKEMLKTCLDQVLGERAEPRQAIEKCAVGDEGKALMKESAKVVKARGVERSCTVAIEGRKRCVRDGGRWYDCPGGSTEADFIGSLCSAYKAKTGRDPPQDVCPGALESGAAAAAAGKGE